MCNEILLCIWDYLSSADVIYSFSNLNTRLNCLLSEFYGLYKKLDLRYCSLAACRFLSRIVPSTSDWYFGLTVLKLGNSARCSQIELFLDGVIKSLVEQQGNFSRNTKSYKHLKPIFPQLTSLHISLTRLFDEDSIDILLSVIAGGAKMRRFTCHACPSQIHHSQPFFDWLFRCSTNLAHYRLQISQLDDGFQLTYEHTINQNYIPHYSLAYLKIDILDLNTFYVLIHYLPKLEHLDVNITKVMGRTDDFDQTLIGKCDYPKNLRVLILRHFQVAGPNCFYLDQLVEKFHNTLEEFSLFFVHFCDGQLDICFDSHRLATLCNRLTHLKVLHFAIHLRFLARPSQQILYHFIKGFQTSFWLDGPLGQMRVCVNYHQLLDFVQIFSLPYKFYDNTLYRTTDFVDTLFNVDERIQMTGNDLSFAFKSLWCGMRCLLMCFLEKEEIPISLLYALQCPSNRNQTLAITGTKGIMPNDIYQCVQLTQFTSVQLLCESEITTDYNIQRMSTFVRYISVFVIAITQSSINNQTINWFRLLPNIKSLFVGLCELRHWITNDSHNQYLNTFLQRLDGIFIECSSITNEYLNEEMMIPFLSFILNKQRFSQLEYLRFFQFQHVSSAWCIINKWTNYILNHCNEHQLKYLQFSLIENDQLLTNMKTADEIITISDPPRIIDIHRSVSNNNISFWMENR
ncbi:unnamed protein product [Adineta ricciae]|uniref:F-box domain-containing protein n=1 Tax=Adineta ricciae TaxID=249248 RepID=A0A814YSH9_ADIRI|nr:unnamed protein product [Adineta ricciae]